MALQENTIDLWLPNTQAHKCMEATIRALIRTHKVNKLYRKGHHICIYLHLQSGGGRNKSHNRMGQGNWQHTTFQEKALAGQWWHIFF